MPIGIYEGMTFGHLSDLLRQIHTREMALPNFQRNFVWDGKATQELIVSIAKNYPAGTILRLQNTNDPLFGAHEFEEAPPLKAVGAEGDANPHYLVLDGQQRLTSLYQAFTGTGDNRYFLDIRALHAKKAIEDCIFHHPAVTKKAKYYSRHDVQAKELVLPISVLGPAGALGHYDLEAWKRNARSGLGNEEALKRIEVIEEVQNDWISTIQRYQFPVITLSREITAEAVCTIFETLNNTGVRLSTFDLLRARYFARNIDLRELWKAACDTYPSLGAFAIDPYTALQIIALLVRPNASCKYSDVLALQADAIQQWWAIAVKGLASALDLLRDNCGVVDAKWLPYSTMLVPLGGVLARFGEEHTQVWAIHMENLVRWFWCSVFSQGYESSSDSRASADYRELSIWLQHPDSVPTVVTQFKFDPKLLRSTTSRQRALYRAVFALLLSKTPLDFHTGSKITGAVMREGTADDHHIFPKAMLLKRNISEREINCVLNRTLIDRRTNRLIADRAPRDYMAQIRKTVGDTLFDTILTSHCIPTGGNSPIWQDDWPSFLQRRQDALWTQIQSVTKASTAADEVDDAS
jgi:hypothetical protein